MVTVLRSRKKTRFIFVIATVWPINKLAREQDIIFFLKLICVLCLFSIYYLLDNITVD